MKLKRNLLLLLIFALLSCDGYGQYFTTEDASNAVAPQPVFVFALPDSGQITCSSGAGGDGAMAACPQTVTGQDGDYVDTPSAWSLSVSDGGDTIADSASGLVWQRLQWWCWGSRDRSQSFNQANLKKS